MTLEAAISRSGASPQDWFDEMADAAIRRSELVVAGKRLAILEVEFYLHRADHPDTYVHRSAAQLNTTGEWYFHREKAAKLGFTLKGADVTFGRAGEEYGGMLIRAVSNTTGGGYVEGPSKVVDALLGAAGVTSVLELKQLGAFDNRVFAPDGLVRIEERRDAIEAEIRAGPRIGLSDARPYVKAPYRYRARPVLTKKDKAGIMAGRIVPDRPTPRLLAARPIIVLSDAEIDELLGL
jgi:hypothetical protein